MKTKKSVKNARTKSAGQIAARRIGRPEIGMFRTTPRITGGMICCGLCGVVVFVRLSVLASQQICL